MKPIEYKGYTIEEDHFANPYGPVQYMYYPTEQGVQHDADCTDGESFSYCGNCKWENSLEKAMAAIDELHAEFEEQNAQDLALYERERKG